MYTLGINAAFHDASACVIKDGRLLAAAEEERFTHIKHSKRPVPFSAYELPYHAIDYCLGVAGIHINDIDHFAYSFDPFILLGEDYRNATSITLPMGTVGSPVEGGPDAWDPLFLSYIVNAHAHLRDGWPHHLQPRFLGARAKY